MANPVVSSVEVRRIGDVEVTHEVLEISSRGSDDKMKVVHNEDEGEDFDLVNIA